MTHRSSWKAFLRLSLVWVPVKAYPAAVSGNHPAGGARRPQFHQLHADCGCRIRYQKQCPRHGEVAPEAIVSGYQYARDQYVVIDPAELDKLHSEDDRAITISEFIPPEALDPIYAGGKSYYLLPDGPAGHRPYAVLCRAMQQAGRHALARAVLRGRAQLLLLRPLEGLLIVSNLAYDHQIVRPSAFADQLPAVKVEAEELALARSLVEAASSETFDYSGYRDRSAEQLGQLIEAKLAGTEPVVAPPASGPPSVGNLIDALRESLAQLSPQTPSKKSANGRPRQKSARRRVAASRRRKSS